MVTGVCDGGQGRGGAVWSGGGGAGGVANVSSPQQLTATHRMYIMCGHHLMPDNALLPRDGPVLVGYDALQLPLLPHQITLKQVQRLGITGSGVKTKNINNLRASLMESWL